MGFGIIFLAAIAGGFVWWYFNKRLYKFSIVVLENISGEGWRIAMKDNAKYLRLSKDGTEILWLRKKKMPLTAYGRKMGINQYWFAIAQDGGWYNVVLGDLDAKMGTLDIEPVDRDIKLTSVALRRSAHEDYGPKQTFMDRYGSWIFGSVTFLIFFGGIWFMLDQIGQLTQSLAVTAQEFTKIVEPLSRALANLDSICSGGSGITPA